MLNELLHILSAFALLAILVALTSVLWCLVVAITEASDKAKKHEQLFRLVILCKLLVILSVVVVYMLRF